MAVFLREVTAKSARPGTGYPACVPVIARFQRLSLDREVTILCGGNGAGKTTLMELLACGTRAVRIDEAPLDDKRTACIQAARAFTFSMLKRPKHCFYFQAEAFIRYIDSQRRMKAEACQALEALEAEYAARSDYARSLAALPHARSLQEMAQLYGTDIAARSHGEGFLDFFAARLRPGGLYLLDEPEGALSYENQLVMLSLIRHAVLQGSQFILATHSPILAACPGARLYEIEDGDFHASTYQQLRFVAFLQRFLRDQEGTLRLFGVYDEEE